MSLSDCSKCWETPCVCSDALGYRHLSTLELLEIVGGLHKIIAYRTLHRIDPAQRQHEVVSQKID